MSTNNHFDKTFWYIAGTTFAIFLYVALITFLDIPEKNQRFVDIALAFLLGRVSSNDSYLTGGNPMPAKKTSESASGDALLDGDQITVTKE